MRIAISAEDPRGLESMAAQHFGRCPYYILVDIEDNTITDIRTLPNPYLQNHTPGAVPGFIHEQGAAVMLTGGMGRRAIAFFEQYGIEAFTGVSGTVRQALEQYLGGELRDAEPCSGHEGDHEHHAHEPGQRGCQ